MKNMLLWTLLSTVVLVVMVEQVDGRSPWLPPLPALPMKDGCYITEQELQQVRVQGEAVILSFPIFASVLRVRKIAPPPETYLITKDSDGAEGVAYQSDGHIQQRDRQLWLLPAQASDSGVYVCTYRNESYCISGRVTLQVYESDSVDMDKLSYPISVTVGEALSFRCPSLSLFNRTDRLIEWYKNSSSSSFGSGSGSGPSSGSVGRDRGKLLIPAVRRSDAGVYTCQLTVVINQQQYRVSRVVVLQVQGQDPEITTAVTSDPSVTSDPGLISTTSVLNSPVIISPLNGSVFEGSHGSAVELFCEVLTECQTVESTVVTWLVNGQSVESSYLEGRALQGGRSVSEESEFCQIQMKLIVVGLTEEDEGAELKCVAVNGGGKQEVVARLQLEDTTFTWVAVTAGGFSCFLAVVSVFLFVLLKPARPKKADYILARQSSTFSA